MCARPRAARASQPIVFFDGNCSLCNRVVDTILRADVGGKIRFAPLNGRTANDLLTGLPPDPASGSVVFLDHRGVFRESDAVIEVCRQLGGWWGILGPLRILPRGLRDFAYRFVASRRYAWFGRNDGCRVPRGADRDRFLP